MNSVARVPQSSLGRAFQAHVLRHGQPQSRDRYRAQTCATDPHHADQGEECTDPGQDYSAERSGERVMRQLNQRAIKMGMRLVAAEPST